ncbi:hypothetical protein GL213_13850 [Halogeometricum borinquense]|uniref:Uncharacterized protein n=1 Tax=Halogeometricum borinquense TaxID=60847 RepID=A0A6C0UCN8_9EURY|nr:hypothetical protein [Halogeometricum borinquense]QIB73086.1 hypothetical protein G3I44_01590 [Halogeometricum borinquense]QIQ77514.1 hypothetical protein GL213_13850 [Halogeometricum borinquense]
MRRDAPLAAVLTPVAFTSYLLSLRVRPGVVNDPRTVLLYIVLLAAIGLLVVVGHRRGLLTPLPITTVLLLLVPWVGFGPRVGPGPRGVEPESLIVFDFLVGVALAGTVVLSLAVVEHLALKHPRVNDALDGETGVGSLSVGVLHAAIVIGFSGLQFRSLEPATVGLAVWVTTGLVFLGAVPIYVALKTGRLAPAGVIGTGVGLVLIAPTGGQLSFGSLYAVCWLLPFVLSLLAADAERRLRRRHANEPSVKA